VPRFIAVSESELAALFRHLAHIFCEEGFEASAVVELDGEPPFLALHVNEPKVSLWIWPNDVEMVTLLLEREGEPTRTVNQLLHYESILGGGLIQPIQRYLIHALDPGGVSLQPPV